MEGTSFKAGTISGTVYDTDGRALAGAAVSAGGRTKYTDPDGSFSLDNVAPKNGIIVQFSFANYVTTQQKVNLPPGGRVYLTPNIKAVATTKTVNDFSGGTVSDGDGSITIKGDSLEDSHGHDISGSYIVQFTSFDPTLAAELNAFPGNFAGRTTAGGSDNPFETFGYVNMSVTKGGSKLNLKDGATAEVHIPIPASLQGLPSTPDEIDLWSYSETGGYWIHEGIATQEAGGKYYIGIISHFSYWNCDQPYDTGYIKGQVVDLNGRAVSGAYIRMRPVGWYGSAPYWATLTGLDGKFSHLPVKAGATTEVYARKYQRESTPETTSGGHPGVGEEWELPYPLVIDTTMESLWKYVGEPGFSADIAYNITLDFNDFNTPYVAYRDVGNGDRATVKKFNGVDWATVGNVGFSSGVANNISLKICNNVPYVAYSDEDNAYKATVMKYNSTLDTWEVVGTAGFSSVEADFLSLYVYNDIPYVAYCGPNAITGEVTVMKYNSGLDTWEVVGYPDLSEGQAQFTSLYVYNGIPYVAYEDFVNAYKITVMKYNSGLDTWEVVGAPGVGGPNAVSISLYVYNGIPYVSCSDGGYSYRTCVLSYEAGSGQWLDVGSPGFSAGLAGGGNVSLDIYNGVPYVSYRDGANANLATVMKYNGTAWEEVGGAGFTDGTVFYTSIHICNGIPYIAFNDGARGSKATVLKYEP